MEEDIVATISIIKQMITASQLSNLQTGRKITSLRNDIAITKYDLDLWISNIPRQVSEE